MYGATRRVQLENVIYKLGLGISAKRKTITNTYHSLKSIRKDQFSFILTVQNIQVQLAPLDPPKKKVSAP